MFFIPPGISDPVEVTGDSGGKNEKSMLGTGVNVPVFLEGGMLRSPEKGHTNRLESIHTKRHEVYIQSVYKHTKYHA